MLVQEFEPKVAIEIGIETGIASAYMCKAASRYGGLVIGIDFREDACQLVTNILPTHFYYVFLNERSQTAYTKVQAITDKLGQKPIGLVFQDSSHHYQESKDEWSLYSPMVNGLWVCDDITPAFHDPAIDPTGKGMVQYFEELPGDKRLYQELYPKGVGNKQGVVIV